MFMNNVKVFSVNVLSDYDVENETVEYLNVLKTIVNAVESAKDGLVYYNVVDEENVNTFVLRNTGKESYTLNEGHELDVVLGINHIDDDADCEVFWTPDTMYHWLFLFVNGDYGLDNEEFEQFLEE